MSLRTDIRSWLIYDEDSIGAVFRALETAALAGTGHRLASHEAIEVRAVGNVMKRIAATRIRTAKKEGGVRWEAMEKMTKLMMYAFGQAPPNAEALDELHATVFRIDQRLNSSGSVGPGVHREGVRGD